MDKEQQDKSKRDNWSSRYEFLLSCVGSLVGLGNIWRFPYLCYKNGGGAFLIPYVVFLLLCGMPITYLDMAYCQFSNMSPAKAWICVPLFRGVGFGMTTIAGIVSIYYNVIISWTLFYLTSSFSKTLPWTTCDNPWNTEACYLRVANNGSQGYNSTKTTNGTIHVDTLTRKTATEEFWDNKVLERSAGIEDIGQVRWQLVVCSFSVWIVVQLCLIRGIKSSGKIVHIQIVITSLVDHFPRFFKGRKVALTSTLCFVGFVLGIPCVTQGGVYVLQIMDWYIASVAMVLLSFLELIGLAWIYAYWNESGKVTELELNEGIKYCISTAWAVGVGLAIAAVPLILTIIPSFVEVWTSVGSSLFQKIRVSTKPHDDWGPADDKLRVTYRSRDYPEVVPLQ